MKKFLKILKITFISAFLLFLYLFFNIVYSAVVFSSTYIKGTNVSRDLAVKLIDRGDNILPRNISNIDFKLFGRYSGRGILVFKGNVKFSDSSEWCKINNMNEEKTIRQAEKIRVVPSYLHIDKEIIIEDGIAGGSKTCDNFHYDKVNEICYVHLSQKTFPPLSLSNFDVFQLFCFPYLLRFWESIEVTGNEI